MNLYSKIKISRSSDKSSFKEKVFHQIGALCYRFTHKNVKILIVTSRRSKRWIIPKGWKVEKYKPSSIGVCSDFIECIFNNSLKNVG